MLGKTLLIGYLLVAPAWGAEAPTPPATLEQYVGQALSRNRDLRADRLEWTAARERAPQAGALPNPVLRYGEFIEPVETRVGPQERRLGITQQLPWFGTLGAREDAARLQAEAAGHRVRRAEEALIRNTVTAVAEYHYLDAAVRITESNRQLVARWEDVLRARYSTGDVSYSDLLKAQVELGILDDALTTRQEDRRGHAAQLAALLDLPTAENLPVPRELPLPRNPVDADSLKTLALAHSPELQALEAQAQSKGKTRDVAGKTGWPNLALGLDWIHVGQRRDADVPGNGSDAVMASIALEIPLWRGAVGAAKREAEAAHDAVLERLAQHRSTLMARLENAVFRHRDALRKTRLYEDALIPKGRQSLEAAQAAFESGDGDFLSVLDAERALLEFTLSLERARADLVGAQAELDYLTGNGMRGDQ